MASPICFRLFCDRIRTSWSLALARAGMSRPNRSITSTSTTRSWYSVRPRRAEILMGGSSSLVQVDYFAAVARHQRLQGVRLDGSADVADAAVGDQHVGAPA